MQNPNPFNETIIRAKAYEESGASGIFVPGMTNDFEIKEMAANISVPLNIFSLPGTTDCNKLKELGVKRFSFGNAFSDKVINFMAETSVRLIETYDTSFLYED